MSRPLGWREQDIGAAIADLENGCRIPQLALMGDSGMMNAGRMISWRMMTSRYSLL